MPTPPRPYDEVEAENNRQIAGQIYGYVDRFAPVEVLVRDRDVVGNTVTLIAATNGGSSSHVIPWNSNAVWAPQPSTLVSSARASAPDRIEMGAPPMVDSFGVLFLEDSVLARTDWIYDIPKFPRSLASPASAYAPLEIWPTRVTISGVELKNGRYSHGTINLYDSDYSSPQQQVVIDRRTLAKLELSKLGFKAFRTKFDRPNQISQSIEAIGATRHPQELATALRVVADFLDEGAAEQISSIVAAFARIAER